MVRGLATNLDSLDQRFRLWLRRQGYDGLQQRAFVAITPGAAARLGSIGRFLEQVAYNGRRLAKLNVPPAGVTEALHYFDSLCQTAFHRQFAAERDQLQLATHLVLENAFYQVRASQKHNAHGSEVIKIHYPFHPLQGQSLRVERRAKLPKGEYIFCELSDGSIGGFPSWIADSTKSSTFTIGPPLASAVALAELRKLLDSLHSNSQRGTASLKEMRGEDTNGTKENTGDDTDELAVL